MAQKLILPIDNCQINAGYKVERYRKEWGFPHYGTDMIEKSGRRAVRACGNGVVIAAGMDGAFPGELRGNAVVIVYPEVLLPSGAVVGLACRMFHFESLLCKAGDRVTAGTVIGNYGNTGAYTSGAHLHIEFDTDTAAPAYAFGLSVGGNIIKKGSIDSTVEPCRVLYLGAGQSATTPESWITDGWVNRDSLPLPQLANDQEAKIAALEAKVAQLKQLLAQIKQLAS